MSNQASAPTESKGDEDQKKSVGLKDGSVWINQEGEEPKSHGTANISQHHNASLMAGADLDKIQKSIAVTGSVTLKGSQVNMLVQKPQTPEDNQMRHQTEIRENSNNSQTDSPTRLGNNQGSFQFGSAGLAAVEENQQLIIEQTAKISSTEDIVQLSKEQADAMRMSTPSSLKEDNKKKQMDHFLLSYNNHINTLGNLANQLGSQSVENQQPFTIQELKNFNKNNLTYREAIYKQRRKESNLRSQKSQGHHQGQMVGYVGHLKANNQQTFSQGESQTQASKGNEGLRLSNEVSFDSQGNSQIQREIITGQIRNKHGPGTAPATNSRIKQNWHQTQAMNRTNRINMISKGIEEHFPTPKISIENRAISIDNGQKKFNLIGSPMSQNRVTNFKSPKSFMQPTKIAEFLRMKQDISFGEMDQLLNEQIFSQDVASGQSNKINSDNPLSEQKFQLHMGRKSNLNPQYQNKVFSDTSPQIIEKAKSTVSSKRSSRFKTYHLQNSDQKIQSLGRNIENIRRFNGKKQIESFMQTQLKNGGQRYVYETQSSNYQNIIKNAEHQKRQFDQLDIPIDLSHDFKSSQKAQEEWAEARINQIKIPSNFRTQKQQGLSVYFQDTHQNFFKVPAQTKAYNTKGPLTPFEIDTLTKQREIDEKMAIAKLQLAKQGQLEFQGSQFQGTDSLHISDMHPNPKFQSSKTPVIAPRTPAQDQMSNATPNHEFTTIGNQDRQYIETTSAMKDSEAGTVHTNPVLKTVGQSSNTATQVSNFNMSFNMVQKKKSEINGHQSPFFKREMKNAQLKNVAMYKDENLQISQMWQRKQKLKAEQRDYLQQRVSSVEQSNRAHLLGKDPKAEWDLVEQGNLPSLLINATQPARIHTYRNASIFDKQTGLQGSVQGSVTDENSKFATFAPSQAQSKSSKLPIDQVSKKNQIIGLASDFIDEPTGIVCKPVSTCMVDLEDIIYNKQFLKKTFDTKQLTDQFQSLKNKIASKEKRKLEQRNASFFDMIVSEKKQVNTPEYVFKHNVEFDPATKKKKLFQKMYGPDFELNPAHKNLNIVRDTMSSQERGSSEDQDQQSSDSSVGSVSLSSSQERVLRKKLGWKDENDDQFHIDKYIFHVSKKHSRETDANNTKGSIQTTSNANQKVIGLKAKRMKELVDTGTLKTMGLDHFIQQIDAKIKAKKSDPGFEGTMTSYHVQKAAKDLYRIITGKPIDPKAKEYQMYVLNVFKFFPEDPLKNECVTCEVKGIVRNVNKMIYDGEPFDRTQNLPHKHDKEVKRVYCSHKPSDDEELQKRYRVQFWFLNFYKYICVLLMNSELSSAQGDVLENDQDSSKVSTFVTQKQEKIAQIIGKQSITKGKAVKVSKKKMACEHILRNIGKFVENLPDDERNVMKDYLTVKKLLEDPILKLVVVHKPKAVIDYKTKGGEDTFTFDENKELFLNSLANQVLRKYKEEVIQVTRRKHVTFRNSNQINTDCLFNNFDSNQIRKRLGLETQDTATGNTIKQDENKAQQEISTEKMQTTLIDPKSTIELVDLQQNQTDRVDNNDTADQSSQLALKLDGIKGAHSQTQTPHSISARPNLDSKLPLTKHDLVKQLVNVMAERGNFEIVKKYNSHIEDNIAGFLSQAIQFQAFKADLVRKKTRQSKRAKQTYEEEVTDAEMTQQMPIQMKINLYQQFKFRPRVGKVAIQDKANEQYEFYTRTKKLVQGIEDNEKNGGTDIEYFKACRSQHILPIPLLFKNLSQNEIFLQRVHINIEQAKAIRQTLEEAGKSPIQDVIKNPFLIRTIIIDDCGMQDDVFEQILLGVQSQMHIKNIHYINNNHLGPKSAEVLSNLLGREKMDQQIQELNFTNLKLGVPNYQVKTERRDAEERTPDLLYTILDKAERKLQRLKISHINLSTPPLFKAIDEFIEANYYVLTYINLSYCNLQLAQLVELTEEIAQCSKLEYLSIAGNPMTVNGLVPRRVPASLKLPDPTVVLQERQDALAESICLCIEMQPIIGSESSSGGSPASRTLRHIDISELGLKSRHYRRICRAVLKNTVLESINFGSVGQNHGDIQAIGEYLQVKEDNGQLNELNVQYEQITKMIGLKEAYLNVGLAKKIKLEESKRAAMMMNTDIPCLENPEPSLILNRTTRNPELVFNPLDPSNGFSPDVFQQWFPVKRCFYVNCFRYTQIYYNIQKVDLNDFKEITGQENAMKALDKMFGTDYISGTVKSPIVIVNGQINKMINPGVYASLLHVRQLQREQQRQVKMQPYGAVELTGINLTQATHNQDNVRIQDCLNQVLKGMTEQDFKQVLCEVAEEQVCLADLEKMSEHQLKIEKQFMCTPWERMIDDYLLNKNYQHITLVNKQNFDYNERLSSVIDLLIESKQPKKDTKNLSSVSVAQTEERQDTLKSADGDNAEAEQDGEEKFTIEGDDSKLDVLDKKKTSRRLSLESNKDIYYMTQPNYIYAGYLPPGKNTIIIYDRHNHIMVGKEIIIDTTQGYAGDEDFRRSMDPTNPSGGPMFEYAKDLPGITAERCAEVDMLFDGPPPEEEAAAEIAPANTSKS